MFEVYNVIYHLLYQTFYVRNKNVNVISVMFPYAAILYLRITIQTYMSAYPTFLVVWATNFVEKALRSTYLINR